MFLFSMSYSETPTLWVFRQNKTIKTEKMYKRYNKLSLPCVVGVFFPLTLSGVFVTVNREREVERGLH